MNSLFKENGILHQRACTYSPQQNGVVERRHRSLSDTARAIVDQRGLPQKFLPYSVLTATWLNNRNPSRVLEWKTPYEILFDEDPDYSIFKPFGCLVYVMNLTPHRSKFDHRNFKCVFLGYSSSHKEYMAYDLENNKVLTSRDVHFVPNVFPYKDGIISKVPDLVLPIVNPIGDKITSERKIAEEEEEHVTINEDIETQDSDPQDKESFDDQHQKEGQQETQNVQILRRSNRKTHPPIWMNDFVGGIQLISNNQTIGNTPPTFPYFVSHVLSESYINSLFNATMIKEPSCYIMACKNPIWIEAMD